MKLRKTQQRPIVRWGIAAALTSICALSAPAAPAKNTDGEEQGSRLTPCYVGQYKTVVTPEQIRAFIMPANGTVTHLITPGGRILKGTIIGKVNEEELALEKEDLEVAIFKEKIAKEEEIVKLESEKRELLFHMSIPSAERKWIPESERKKVDKQIIAGLDDKIRLAKSELVLSEKKKRAEYRKKEENSIFTMPYTGRVQYQFTLPDLEKTRSQYLESGKEVAAICDDSNLYLTISVSTPEIMQVEPERLSLELTMGNGEKMTGVYSHKRLQKNQGGGNSEMLVFFFKIPEESKDKAYGMIGLSLLSKLYYRPEGETETLNKFDLGRRPEAKNTATWQELIDTIKPGHEVILVGETQILIRKK